MTTQKIRSLDEFSARTTSSDRFSGLPELARGSQSPLPRADVISIGAYAPIDTAVPERHVEIDALVERWSANPKRRAALADARRWVADSVYPDEGETVRTLRLRRGMSQAHLAKTVGTSQPHVARIERGTENLMIDTCRRLSAALGVDMNTLDAALRRQEELSQSSVEPR
jgi:ribosome-binding protein aMBF1 (putative translation factor)